MNISLNDIFVYKFINSYVALSGGKICVAPQENLLRGPSSSRIVREEVIYYYYKKIYKAQVNITKYAAYAPCMSISRGDEMIWCDGFVWWCS